MAVFYDTGGGDIYAGPTKEAVLAEMLKDCPTLEVDQVEEVSGETKMRVTDEDDEPTSELITLAEEYGNDTSVYCICTTNS